MIFTYSFKLSLHHAIIYFWLKIDVNSDKRLIYKLRQAPSAR